MIQVLYDWFGRYAIRKFEREFKLVFKGPGLYLTPTSTLLVLPDDTTAETIWNSMHPTGTLYEVWIWNLPFEQTLLAVIGRAPTRTDSRDGAPTETPR